MKIIQRTILPFQEKLFFHPIRDKIDYAKIVVLASRTLLLNMNNDDTQCNSEMKLIVNKMSRLFFYHDKKYFSISFPFLVQSQNDEVTSIRTLTGRNIDNQDISKILSILQDNQFKLNPSLTMFYRESSGLNRNSLLVLEEILLSEPSYIRYDYDRENENGKLHPLHHLDINYSAYGTFKLGLENEIVEGYFEDTLNINTDCCYLN
ncbi:MAG: hypothetical protein AAGL29_03375 [Bacteroidota bacterium]